MGDFNAKIGKHKQNDRAVGEYGIGERNERGDRLIEFAESLKLYITNSFFKKSVNRKWTWSHGETKNEIDFILTNNKHIFQDTSVLYKPNTGSDHKMVRSKIKINIKQHRAILVQKKSFICPFEITSDNRENFQLKLNNKFEALHDLLEDGNLDAINSTIINKVMECVKETGSKKKKENTGRLSRVTKDLLEQRCRMKHSSSVRERINAAELNKLINRNLRDDVRNYNNRIVETAIENNKSLK